MGYYSDLVGLAVKVFLAASTDSRFILTEGIEGLAVGRDEIFV